jgi:hypothetical protein
VDRLHVENSKRLYGVLASSAVMWRKTWCACSKTALCDLVGLCVGGAIGLHPLPSSGRGQCCSILRPGKRHMQPGGSGRHVSPFKHSRLARLIFRLASLPSHSCTVPGYVVCRACWPSRSRPCTATPSRRAPSSGVQGSAPSGTWRATSPMR